MEENIQISGLLLVQKSDNFLHFPAGLSYVYTILDSFSGWHEIWISTQLEISAGQVRSARQRNLAEMHSN